MIIELLKANISKFSIIFLKYISLCINLGFNKMKTKMMKNRKTLFIGHLAQF